MKQKQQADAPSEPLAHHRRESFILRTHQMLAPFPCSLGLLVSALLAVPSSSQPPGIETFIKDPVTGESLAGFEDPDCSRFFDIDSNTHQLVFTQDNGRSIRIVDLVYDNTNPTSPVLQAFRTPVRIVMQVDLEFGTIGSPRFNPAKTDSVSDGDPGWTERRYILFRSFPDNAPDHLVRIRTDGSPGTEQQMDDSLNPPVLRNLDFPHWSADGEWAVHEANGTGGNDPAVRSFFAGNMDRIVQLAVGEVNEYPVAFQNPNHPVTANMVFYAKSIGLPGFPRYIHRQEVLDPNASPPDDFFLTVGGNVNTAASDGDSIVYHKEIQGFTQLFRNRYDDETFDHRVSRLLGDGAGGLGTAKQHSVLRTPSAIVLGDFDGNGAIDAGVATQDSCRISFLMGDAQGVLSRGVIPVPPGSGPFDVDTADLHGADADLDLVVVERSLDRVRILSGDGAGNFADAASYSLGTGAEPVAVTTGDLDGDGHADLAVANRGQDSFSTLLRDPNDLDSFLPPTAFSTGVGSAPSDILTDDLNGDGNLDLVVSMEGEKHVEIWEGDGAGSFTHVATLLPIVDPNLPPLQLTPSGLALADVDFVIQVSDPNATSPDPPDVLASNLAVANVFLWKNNSTPTAWSFTNAIVYSTGDKPTGIAVAEVTGDGYLDLITANMGDDTASILPGTGGAFDEGGAVTIGVGKKPWKVVTGRLLGNDKMTDIAIACGNDNILSLVERNPNAAFPGFSVSHRLTTRLATAKSPRSLTAGDFDGDGALDLASANFLSDSVSVFNRVEMIPGTTIMDPQSYHGPHDIETEVAQSGSVARRPIALATFDYDGDAEGHADLVVVNIGAEGNSGVQVYRGEGNGSFTLASSFSATGQNGRFTSVAAGDFTGDGLDDFVVVGTKGLEQITTEMRVYRSTGSGFVLQQSQTLEDPSNPDPEDVRGPRYVAASPTGQSLIVLCGLGSTVLRFVNDGNGNFTRVQKIASPEPRQIALEDFDGDGHLDGALTGNGEVAIYRGQSGGTFMATPLPPMQIPGAYAIASGHFNGDGAIDLAVTSIQESNVRILLNTGGGTFQVGAPVACGPGPVAIAAGDLNLDGKTDVLVANAFGAADEILTDKTTQFAHPVGSPDGQKIVCMARVKHKAMGQIHLLDLTSSERPLRPSVVTSLDVGRARLGLGPLITWGPESRRIYYRRDADPNDLMGQPAGLYVLRGCFFPRSLSRFVRFFANAR